MQRERDRERERYARPDFSAARGLHSEWIALRFDWLFFIYMRVWRYTTMNVLFLMYIYEIINGNSDDG